MLGQSHWRKCKEQIPYLLKLLLTNIREAGKHIICLDPEDEYEELCSALGGCYIDFMSGEYTINPLEPKAWNEQAVPAPNSRTQIDTESDVDVRDQEGFVPEAFKKVTRLSQHIAFLKDFFRAYKDFSDMQIDTIEILLSKLYARFGITDSTDYSKLKPNDYPKRRIRCSVAIRRIQMYRRYFSL